ncbi:MAG: hypothetical protein GTO51_11170 [Candidatus Latescibacteria bacterium]|nr:hypothetical protein [Candidatus Latescibacterota bacterium]NIM66524.1 hypothetical protein [Candidatus Latescibacterota bacterium]NIO03004.1 hypothetical protein [Candidatus Latescibacterota bacterium]NIO57758.1 hypothetical protein [Candidatus Latescibacterota bacterium]NIT03293.1 hypothetical protein [Candidatus Latescibacterota bacterium]
MSTLRAFGTGSVAAPAAVLLGGASFLAMVALLLTLRGGRLLRENGKLILVFLFGVHLTGVLFFFPPEDVLNNRPVLTLDHAVHYYQAARARDIFWDSMRLHGYDPNFMAGYPGGTIFDIDMKGAELWCSLLAFLGVARALKLFILLSHLSMVFTVFWGCRRLGYRYEESIFASLLLLAYWHWGRPYAGDFRFAGMFGFIFVTHLSFYLVGMFKTLLDGDPCKRFFIIGPLAFFIHPTAAVLLPIPFLALFLIRRLKVSPGTVHLMWQRKVFVQVVIWCAIVLAVNAIWLVPFFRYLDIKLPSETFFQIRGVQGLAGVLLKPGNLPALIVIILSIIGFVRLIADRRLPEAIAPASAAAYLFFLSGYGVRLPGFSQMEPGRFVYSAMIFLTPLSGSGFLAIFNGLERAIKINRLLVFARAAALVVLFLCPAPLALLASRSYYKHTIGTTPRSEVEDLIDALNRHIDPSGRLMVEDGPAWTYGDSHIPSILPLLTGVQQIGGPYPFTFIEHHFATFQLDKTMGKPLDAMDPEELSAYVELYNVHWVVTATPAAKTVFSRIHGFPSVWSSKHFVLWEVPGRSTFASEPGVSVRATYDTIHVAISADAGQPAPDSILIRYHWDRGLVASPPARISPVWRLRDPVPFILLEPEGEADIRITFN